MVRPRRTGHTAGHMNALFPSTIQFAASADAGGLALALFFGVLTTVFTLRMERRREK